MASGLYGKTFLNSLNNSHALDLDNDTIKIMLVTSSYTPDFGAHDLDYILDKVADEDFLFPVSGENFQTQV